MSTSSHVILRSYLKVIIHNHDKHLIIQHKIDKIVQKQLTQLLDSVFSKHIPEDVVIHLNTISIDGGIFTIEDLDRNFSYKIQNALSDSLKTEIDKITNNIYWYQNNITPLPLAKIQAIEHYLSEGNFAWWMTQDSKKDIEQLYLELLDKSPASISQLWHNLHKKDKATLRFSTNFSQTTLEKTIKLLLPASIQDFTSIIEEVGSILDQTEFLKDRLYTSKHQLLSLVLEGLIVQKNILNNKIEFLDMLLKQVATKNFISYEKVLSNLKKHYDQTEANNLTSHKANRNTELLIYQLHDLLITPPYFRYPLLKTQEVFIKRLDDITTTITSPYQIENAIQDIQQQISHPEIADLFKSWLKEPTNRMRLARKLPEHLVLLLVPTLDDSIGALFQDLINLYRDILPFITPSSTLDTAVATIKITTLAYCAGVYSPSIYIEKITKLFSSLISATQPYKKAFHDILNHYQKAIVPKTTDFMTSILACLAEKYTETTAQQESSINNKSNTTSQPYNIPSEAIYEEQILDNPSNTETCIRSPFSIENLIHFLVSNELPLGQQVPAYFIDNSLAATTPQAINQQLAPLCKETRILRKVILHATPASVTKLFQSLIPLPSRLLDLLEKIIIQTGIIKNNNGQPNVKLIQELLIQTSINPTQATTEAQYIERLIMYVSVHASLHPSAICKQLLQMAEKEVIQPFVDNNKTIITGDIKDKKLRSIEIHEPFIQNINLIHHTTETVLKPETESITTLQESIYNEHSEQLTQHNHHNIQPQTAEQLNTRNLIHHTTETVLKPETESITTLQESIYNEHSEQLTQHNHHNIQPQTTEQLNTRNLIHHTTETVLKPEIESTTTLQESIYNEHSEQLTQHNHHKLDCIHKKLSGEATRIAEKIEAYNPSRACINMLAVLSEKLSSLQISSIDEVDIMLLPTHERLATLLDKKCLAIYYTKIIPALKSIIQERPKKEIDTTTIQKIIDSYLGEHEKDKKYIQETVIQNLQEAISNQKEKVKQKWYLFLDTGIIGNYQNPTELFTDVLANTIPLFLKQTLEKKHVRQRLIAHFSHSQLMLFIAQQADQNFIHQLEDIYYIWCNTQHALGGKIGNKNLFWDVVLQILSEEDPPFYIDVWIEKIIKKLSNGLEITPVTLLQTFQILIDDTKELPCRESLANLCHKLENKVQRIVKHNTTKQTIIHPVLKELHLLLHNGYMSYIKNCQQDDGLMHKLDSEQPRTGNTPTTYAQGLTEEEKQKHLPYTDPFSDNIDHKLLPKIVHHSTAIQTLETKLVELMAHEPQLLWTMIEEETFNKKIIVRRMVYYFSETMVLQWIYSLAKDKAALIIHYLHLLNQLPERIQNQLNRSIHGEWKKEVSISMIDYLCMAPQIDPIACLQQPFLSIPYIQGIRKELLDTISNLDIADPIEKKKMHVALERLQNIPNKSDPGRGLHELMPPNKLPETKPDVITESIAEQKEVRVHLKNSGLVFLWPFLSGFFEEQNVLANNQFNCKQAIHNGVYFLQYLVSKQFKASEIELLLPKLLCGLDYDEVLLPYCPIDENEDEHTLLENLNKTRENLIQTAIKRWETLTKLKQTTKQEITSDFLTNYFLAREGVLLKKSYDEETNQESWQLSIMRHEYDYLDLLPPWHTSNISLPWMNASIDLYWLC